MADLYKPLYIKIGQSGAYSESMQYDRTIDTKYDFGLYVKSVPFIIQPQVKNIITQEWKDEDGEDAYIPSVVTHKAYDFTVEFIYLWNDGMANVRINQFIETIRGKWLKIYDTYTQTCRKGCYMVECNNSPSFKRRFDMDYVYFKVKFKCNFPTNNEVF